MQIPEKDFIKFKELYKQEFGDEEYNKMTEQQLFESATKLLKLVEIVYRNPNKTNDITRRI